jgi:hypothetical protein
VLASLVTAWLALPLAAQDEPAADPVWQDLPEQRHLAASLSDPDSRGDTLLTLIAVTRLLDYGRQPDPARLDELADRFRDERAWLDRLAARFTALPWRVTLFDPAAWYLLLQLEQHDLLPGPLVSPLGPDAQTLLRQLFERGDERLAATVLPELLPAVETQANATWQRLLQQLPSDPGLAALAMRLNEQWFDPWAAAEPPAPTAAAVTDEAESALELALDRLHSLAADALHVGPPDALRLKRLRFDLLLALPELDEAAARDAGHVLALASALDGLYRREYLALTQALLQVAAELLLREQSPVPPLPRQPAAGVLADGEPAASPPADIAADPAGAVDSEELQDAVPAPAASRLPRTLTDLLPALSNAYAAEFSNVDPRINTSLAAVFDVMQYLQAQPRNEERVPALRAELADAVAQLVLQIPDLGYYFDQPVRRQISEEIDICISIAVDRDRQGLSTLSREQFDGCLDSLTALANIQASEAELAGDPDGPFGTEQLRRELLLTPWQRINYVLGYLHDQHALGCERPAEPLPNPMEWSSLVTMITWFARQAPVYFQTPANEARIVDLRRRGVRLLEEWVGQVDCISGSGTGVNDPVLRGLADYRRSLERLVGALREAELEFRAARLKPGADVVLHGDASQRTAFRMDNLEIGPCNPANACEMSGRLEPTRALIGLFPDIYLIADQSGLGQVEICYDRVRWVERRSEPVRADDPHVANYYGRLSFDLLGRYADEEGSRDVFGFTFTSPGEYHYLFAAATEEVLGDECPVEWVGSRVVTPLGDANRVRVVPDRLTYLAAARAQPSQLLATNWSRNEEWRDSFITGLNASAHEYPPDPAFADRVNRHLRGLYQAGQAALYNALLRPRPTTARSIFGTAGQSATASLFDELEDLTAHKQLLRSYMNLFYPQYLVDSDELRAMLEGRGALLDRSVLRRFRESTLAVSAINDVGIARLEQFQALWNRQPEAVRRSGSSAISVAHAITRLNALHTEFFDGPAAPSAREAAVSPQISLND